MARYTKEFYVAMDSFLHSEMIRHQEDIDAIIAKRQLLADLGYSSDGPAPWINDEDIEPQDVPKIDTEFGPCPCTVCQDCGKCDKSHEQVEEDGTLSFIL